MSFFHLADALNVVVIALLLWACVTDWRERIIPHWLNISLAALAPLSWWLHGFHFWPDVAAQIGLCLGVLLFFAIFQAIGMMGGGDVKMLGAIALWLPWQVMMQLLYFMSLAGGVLTLAMLVYHKIRKFEGKPEIPYGIAISFAGLIIFCEHYINQFR